MACIINIYKIPVPRHLNESFFVETLKEGLRETNIKLYMISFEWGSNVGENYCSAIYRVLLFFKRSSAKNKEALSLIVKTIPISEDTRFLEDIQAFNKEKQTYIDILPRLEVISNGERFGAKYYHSIKQPVQTIVFEELKVDGFKLSSREKGLDWEHASLVLQQLGKFHATSMVLAKKDPEIVKQYQRGMLSEETLMKSDTFENMFGAFLNGLINATTNWTGYESITKHLKRFSDNFRKILLAAAKPKPNDRYIVLNHGDMWTNNFMYAYDNVDQPELPTRAIFVDFQLSFYGSPACDLNFFLNTSVKLEILQQRREELIKIYYKSFRDALEHSRFTSIPSYEDLLWELRSREIYGLFGLFAFLPMITMPKELSSDSSIENMQDENYKRKQMDAIFKQKFLNDYHKWGLKRAEDLDVFNDY